MLIKLGVALSARATMVLSPATIPAEEFLKWADKFLPPLPARILEVGCGSGELALELIRKGFDVTPMDNDSSAVALARERGLSAILGAFPFVSNERYDVLVFSKSFHHLDWTDRAVDCAWSLLRPGGLLIADEVSRESTIPNDWDFVEQTLGLLHSAGALADEPPNNDGITHNGLAGWLNTYYHGSRFTYHGDSEVFSWTRRSDRFEPISSETAPFLYRMVLPHLEPTERGYRIGKVVLEIEQSRILDGTLKPVGLRLILRRRGETQASTTKGERASRRSRKGRNPLETGNG